MVVGIDVASDRLNYVSLTDDGAYVTGGVLEPANRAGLSAIAADARVIAIDAPQQLSTAPHRDDVLLAPKFRNARCAEIALGREHRTWVPWASPTHEPVDPWIAIGLTLYRNLSESSAAELIEVFPYAAYRRLTNPARLAKKTSVQGIGQRTAALRRAGLDTPNLELWSHDSLDAAVAAIVAADRLRDAAVKVTCGHDESAIWLPAMAPRTAFIRPDWPTERFFLVSIPEGWSLGPFSAEDWASLNDGSLLYADGVTHPITLRIRSQRADVLHANDGDLRDVAYQIVPLSKAPAEWRENAR